MLSIAKLLLVISGFFLILDGIFIIAGRPNFINAEWGLPCPIILVTLGLGLILFIVSGGHQKQ